MTVPSALLFDLGGVVLDIDFDRTFASWSRHSGVPLAQLRERFAPDSHYERHERGEIGAGAYFASLRARLGLELDDANMLAGWNALFAGEIDGMRDLLPSLKAQAPLYAFSNTNAVHIEHFTTRHGELLGAFDRLFLSSQLGLRKPEAKAFDAVTAAVGVPPGEILFFDDLEENVEGARARGLQAVLVRDIDDVRAACAPLLERSDD